MDDIAAGKLAGPVLVGVRLMLVVAVVGVLAGAFLTARGAGPAVGEALGVGRGVAAPAGPGVGGVPVAPAPTTVVVQDFAFAPENVRVRAGARVVVDNRDSVIHMLSALDGSSFDTGAIPAHQVGVFTAPTRPGEYPFRCAILPFMSGTLTVTP